MRVFLTTAVALLATIFGAGATTAHAQDVNGSGTFGQTALNSGFTPDPLILSFAAGGSIDSSQTIGGRCTGWIASNPDYTIDYAAGALPFYISAQSTSDTTLVVYAPDKLYYCDDDSDGGLNPMVYLPTPPAGRYQIWVGTFSNTAGTPPATIYVSELNTAQNLINQGAIQAQGLANTTTGGDTNFGGMTLNSGFSPDPVTVAIIAGGNVDASTLFNECRGFVSDQADYRVTYNAGTVLPLILSVEATADTTLIVQGPDGNFYCDDDGGEGPLNPSLNFGAPMVGDYLIWVGAYAQSATGTQSTLYISEISTR